VCYVKSKKSLCKEGGGVETSCTLSAETVGKDMLLTNSNCPSSLLHQWSCPENE
jgi:hypothetical protein